MSIIDKWRNFFRQGHERTVRAKKNVFYSILLKGLGILIGFAYFPISLNYLSAANFGIFLTLASIIDWFAELNIGIGSGLRNKLGQSVAKEDYQEARTYVSTAYYVLASIFSGVFIIFTFVSFFLPWAKWLQADVAQQSEIALLAVLMLAALAIRFVSSLIYEVLFALQQSARVQLFNLLTKVSFLLFLIVIVYTTEESLLLYGAGKTMTFALIPFFVGAYFFRKEFNNFRPTWRLASWQHFKDLFGLGIQFFAIKVAMLVIHKTNNFLIASYVSLEEVPEYEAAFKYLSIILIFFVLLADQLWAANVEAFQKNEYDWLKKNLKSVIRLWVGMSLLSVLMVVISPWVYDLWLGEKLSISLELSIWVCISILLTTWINIFNLVINGAGKIRLQMLTWIAASVLNIPVSIFLATKMGLGTIGIVIGTILCLVPLAIFSPIQARKILNKMDKGIWSK